MSPFEAAPEFIEEDNRTRRIINPVSIQQMHNKHEVMFPHSLVTEKSILDLGCALGATGHWCLTQGAKSYTGIEGQDRYAQKARELLEKYHPGKARIEHMPIEQNLETSSTYDIVCLLGVLYVFVDQYSVLKRACTKAREYVIIESQYPYGRFFRPDFVGVQFLEEQDINLADQDASLRGRGARLSPKGLAWLMQEFGFECTEGQLHPMPVSGVDVYNSMNVAGPRFLMRFSRKHPALT